MNPVTTGTTAARAPKQAGEVRARPAVRLPEDDAGVGELVVGDDQVARVDEGGGPRLAEIGGDDHRGQPLAEARGHVERAQRTMTQEVDALQRAAELGEQRIDLRADGPDGCRAPLEALPAPTQRAGTITPTAERWRRAIRSNSSR